MFGERPTKAHVPSVSVDVLRDVARAVVDSSTRARADVLPSGSSSVSRASPERTVVGTLAERAKDPPPPPPAPLTPAPMACDSPDASVSMPSPPSASATMLAGAISTCTPDGSVAVTTPPTRTPGSTAAAPSPAPPPAPPAPSPASPSAPADPSAPAASSAPPAPASCAIVCSPSSLIAWVSHGTPTSMPPPHRTTTIVSATTRIIVEVTRGRVVTVPRNRAGAWSPRASTEKARRSRCPVSCGRRLRARAASVTVSRAGTVRCSVGSSRRRPLAVCVDRAISTGTVPVFDTTTFSRLRRRMRESAGSTASRTSLGASTVRVLSTRVVARVPPAAVGALAPRTSAWTTTTNGYSPAMAPVTGTSAASAETVMSASTASSRTGSGAHPSSRPMTVIIMSRGPSARLRTCTRRVPACPAAVWEPGSTTTLGAPPAVVVVVVSLMRSRPR